MMFWILHHVKSYQSRPLRHLGRYGRCNDPGDSWVECDGNGTLKSGGTLRLFEILVEQERQAYASGEKLALDNIQSFTFPLNVSIFHISPFRKAIKCH
jgi:hypothetical protein